MVSRNLLTAVVLIYGLTLYGNAQQSGCSTVPACKLAPHGPYRCENIAKAKCELNLGRQYLSIEMWAEASQHCAAALGLANSLDEAKMCLNTVKLQLQRERSQRFQARLDLLDNLIRIHAFTTAEEEFKAFRDFEKAETEKFGPLPAPEERRMDDARARLAMEKLKEWSATITPSVGLRDWLPGVATGTLRILAYLLFVALICGILWSVRILWKIGLWKWTTNQGQLNQTSRSVRWMVSSIADETKQLAAGAVMDALNVYHNPLFQELNTSSLLAMPPGLIPTETTDRCAVTDPSFLIWRNFLINIADRKKVRDYLSDLIEDLDSGQFTRHIFKQVDAFEEINLKLGSFEASLGAIFRNLRRWWTKGWPTVTGSVVIEKIGETSFASIRLICNYDLRSSKQYAQVAQDKDVPLNELFSEGRTFAVFASTKIDEFADAVALASQRAAFRLIYRLAKLPAEPNLAIAASSYRQGLRLLTSVL